MPRLFVAAELGPAARTLAADIESELRVALRRKVRIRWTRPEGRHVTLAFIGQVTDEQARVAGDTMAKVATICEAFDVAVGGVGAFPNARRSRVLWVGVNDPDATLVKLATEIQKELRQAGFAVDDREFRGHITLGRVADRRGMDLSDALENCSEETLSIKLDAMVLFESHLAPSGARYRPLRRILLGKNPL